MAPEVFIRDNEHVVTRHLLRRTARERERELTNQYATDPFVHFRVVKSRRGPGRYYVVRSDDA